MTKIQVYFDSCVLLDSIIFRQGYTRVNNKRKFDIARINPQKAEVLISDLNAIEVMGSLKDSKASQIAINEGYSYFDLRKDRVDEIKLSKKELSELNKIFEKELVTLPCVVAAEAKGFSANEIRNLVRICNEHSTFIIDAMHFLIADKEGCQVFVTSDKDLRKGLLRIKKGSLFEKNIEILTPQQFKKGILEKVAF